MYADKQQDHEKRAKQEGSYSVYNYMYRYLMDNYEPEQLNNIYEQVYNQLVKIGKEYCIKGGTKINDGELNNNARQAITNFIDNNGEHGDTANNLGKAQDNSFENIKRSLMDLKY